MQTEIALREVEQFPKSGWPQRLQFCERPHSSCRRCVMSPLLVALLLAAASCSEDHPATTARGEPATNAEDHPAVTADWPEELQVCCVPTDARDRQSRQNGQSEARDSEARARESESISTSAYRRSQSVFTTSGVNSKRAQRSQWRQTACGSRNVDSSETQLALCIE